MSTTTPTAKLSSLIACDDAEWVDLIDVPGAKMQVRPLDYTPYQIARDTLFQRFGRKYGRKPIPRKELLPALGRLYAEHILVNWEGFDEPYSQGLAAEKLGDWNWRKLISQVEWAASTLSDVNAEFLEDAGKNSEQLSAIS